MKTIKCSFLLIVILFCNCSTIKKSFRTNNIPKEKITIAVIPASKRVSTALVDGITFTFLEEKFDVVDRTKIESLIKENELSLSGLTEPKTMRRLGKLVDVNTLCIVYGEYSSRQAMFYYKGIGGTYESGNVKISIKMIDLETSRYLYVFESHRIGYSFNVAGAENAIVRAFKRDIKKKF